MRTSLGLLRILKGGRISILGLSQKQSGQQDLKSHALNLLLVLGPLIFVPLSAGLNWGATLDSWYFTSDDIEVAYRYQQQFGPRLQRPINPTGCHYGQQEFLATYQGKEFKVPCSFISEIKRQLRAMIEDGAARYLFPLDADHAHLAIPTEIWETKYRARPTVEILADILREPKLIALYHTAEHLSVIDPKTGLELSQAKDWQAKRNVLGFFDNRPNKILSPNDDGSGHDKLDGYENVGSVYFFAHRLGEIVFSIQGKSVPFDLSFDEDSAAPVP
jgi:hypothetical protein